MKHIKTLRIDIDKKNFEEIPSVQYDSNTRYLHIHLLDNSMAFDITNCSVKISGNKPDGTNIFNNCNIINAKEGFIETELTEQMNAVAGKIKCELKIYDGNGVLTTKPFIIEVTASITSKDIVSTNEYKALTDAINSVQNIDNRFAEVNGQLNDINSKIDVKNDFISLLAYLKLNGYNIHMDGGIIRLDHHDWDRIWKHPDGYMAIQCEKRIVLGQFSTTAEVCEGLDLDFQFSRIKSNLEWDFGGHYLKNGIWAGTYTNMQEVTELDTLNDNINYLDNLEIVNTKDNRLGIISKTKNISESELNENEFDYSQLIYSLVQEVKQLKEEIKNLKAV